MIGRTIGPYRIVDKLGEGGMGVVYRAEDSRLGRLIALKCIAPDRLPHEDARRRFDREARAAATLSHPNICTVHEVGTDEHGAPFLVLELLAGPTLKQRLTKGPLELDELLALAVPIADALDHAHQRGVVHRDLKPSNIVLTEHGPKLLDFGLAKVVERSAHEDAATRSGLLDMTGPHSVLGTLAYMSPEQARGQTLDARTDIFSFGAVLYEMATGQAAFGGDTSGVMLENVLTKMPPLYGPRPRAVAPGLDAILSKALEKDRDLRYQSAREMAVDLRRLRGSTSSATAARSGSQVVHDRSSRLRRRWGAGAALVIGLAAWAGWTLWTGQDRPVTLELGAIQQVTSLSGLEDQPTISPDGAMVAFVWQETDNKDIWVKQTSGGAPLRITHDPADDTEPDWSPDGTTIVFRSGRGGGGLFTVPALGGDATRLTTFGARPRWSPDGKRIAFDLRPGGLLPNQVYVLDYPNGQPVVVLENPHQFPAWSPDGAYLTSYAGAQSLPPGLFMSPSTGRQGGFYLEWKGERLVSPTTRSLWTPDARALLLQSSTLAYVPLDVARRVAGPLARLTTAADALGDLSTNGRLLTYVSGRTTQTDVWKVPLDPATGLASGPPVRVINSSAEDKSPKALPDNRHVLFLSNREGQRHLYVADFDGQNVRVVDKSRDWYGLTSVSPDGRAITLLFRGDPRVANQAYVLPFDPERLEPAGPARPIGGNTYPGNYSPDSQSLVVSLFGGDASVVEVWEKPASAQPVRRTFQLDESIKAGALEVFNHVFAADGRWIYFQRLRQDGSVSHFAVRPDGRDLHHVTDTGLSPVANPNARRLYVSNWRSDGSHSAVGVMDVDPITARVTSAYHPLRFEPGRGSAVPGSASFSYDGRWFFFAWTDQEGDVYVANLIVR